MTTSVPQRSRQSYRHEAFLWEERAAYVGGLVPYVVDGLDAGEAVLAVITPEHAGWIRDELGPRASEVHFVDMVALGSNPPRVLPALQAFLDAWCAPGLPARAFGDPMWPGQRREEVGEMQLNEALVNLTVDPDLPFWLICAYRADHLDELRLADVACSHPVIATPTSYAGSAGYRGQDHARELFAADLCDLGGADADVRVAATSLDLAAQQVTLRATDADLLSDRVVLLTDVVRGLVVDSIRRGAGTARLRLWDEPAELVCEVSDPAEVDDLLVGRRPPTSDRLDPVWFANQVCDLVEVRSNQHGTSVRLHLGK